MNFGVPVSCFPPDKEATLQLRADWVGTLAALLTVYLQDSLGTGKTTFTHDLLCGLGYTGAVKSPTYIIVEFYILPRFVLHHFDLYRFASPEEWEDAGLDGLFALDCVCLIEWPQQGDGFTLPADITISFNHTDGGRACTLTAHAANGRKSLEAWSNRPEDESSAKRPVPYLS